MRCYIWAYRGPRRARSKLPARYLRRTLRITLHTWRTLRHAAHFTAPPALRHDLRRCARTVTIYTLHHMQSGTALLHCAELRRALTLHHLPNGTDLLFLTLHTWRRKLLTKKGGGPIHNVTQRESSHKHRSTL